MSRFLTVVTAILFYALPLFSQNIWTKQSSVYTENFRKVVFADSLYGWIVGDSGLIINTTNGGNNWVTQSRNSNDYLIDIFFLNRVNGWSIAWRVFGSTMQSIIYTTSNGGQNWFTYVYPDSTTLLNTVYFLNSQTGFIGCSYTSTKAILITTNGGVNWYPSNVDTNFASNFPVKKFKFLDEYTGFAVGGYFDISGVIWKTTDGGNHWSSKANGGEPFNSIDFLNTNTIVLSGGDYEYGVSVNYSTDSGESWNWFYTGYFGIGYSLSFRTISEGWITAGYSQMFLKTTNSGASWINAATPDSTSVYSLIFPNQKTGWAVGDNGSILKYTANTIGVNNQENITPVKMELFPNYPNPFNSGSRIKFNISKLDDVKIVVYDVMGREISTLLDKRLQPGSYEIFFDGSQLASGVYYYRLSAGDFKKTKKMILLK